MSTRATYQFKNKNNKCTTCVYIHYDGYPEGAAQYFYNTLMNPSKGDFATQFIRANEEAGITSSHSAHADTEYQYDIEGSGPEADLKAYKIDDDGEKRLIAFKPVHEFIHQNLGYTEGNDYKPFKVVQLLYQTKILNATMAYHEISHPLHHLRIWKGHYEGSANWNSCVKEVQLLVNAFPELFNEELKEYGIKVWSV